MLRRLASAVNKWVDETLGIKRIDGTLPDSVVNANLMVEGMVTVANAALEKGKLFAYESPVSRAHTSQFAVQEREDHTEMSSHPELASLIERYGLVRRHTGARAAGRSRCLHSADHGAGNIAPRDMGSSVELSRISRSDGSIAAMAQTRR